MHNNQYKISYEPRMLWPALVEVVVVIKMHILSRTKCVALQPALHLQHYASKLANCRPAIISMNLDKKTDEI